MRKITLSFLMALSFIQCLFSQNNIIETSLDTNIILIGQQTNYTISAYIENENIDKIQFPVIQDTLIKDIEVIDQETDTIRSESFVELHKMYTITSFDTNYYIIPELNVVIGLDTVKTQKQMLSVTIQKVNQETLNDIKANIEFEYNLSDYTDLLVNWILLNKWWIISMLLLVVTLIIVWIKFKKKRTIIKEVIKLDPAHIEAYISLMKIKEMKQWENDNLKPFYSEITEVLKRYLNRKYNVLTYEKTSKEIVKSLQFINLTKNEVFILKKLLTLSDLVKFAKEKPIESENIEVINMCESWIKNIENKELGQNEQ